MKIQRILACAAFALALPIAAHANFSARGWLENYYQNPRPDYLPAAVTVLSNEGYFQEPGHAITSVGFLAAIFAQNPDRVDAWLSEMHGLPVATQRIFACALWKAGNPRGAGMLRWMSRNTSEKDDIAAMLSRPNAPVGETPVLNTASMNLQWGAFLATGDQKYIVNVLVAIGTGQPGLDEAARFALAKDAAAHPLVMDICRNQLSKQPEQVQSVLRAALNDAASTHANQPRS